MKVNEIFNSIDGQGIRAGELTTFIRLAGCNLRCSYCDTSYALERRSGKDMQIGEILSHVMLSGYKNITITGGEPLMDGNVTFLVSELLSYNKSVNIETNGSLPIDDYLKPGVIITLDYKTKSSGYNGFMNKKNYDLLRQQDVLKFVMAEEDMYDVYNFLAWHELNCWIYLSPVFGKIEPKQLVQFQKKCFKNGINTNKMRVQLQLHKYIWSPDEKGV